MYAHLSALTSQEEFGEMNDTTNIQHTQYTNFLSVFIY